MNSDDRELLYTAAEAAGFTVRKDITYDDFLVINDGQFWNPLIHDGDALRLAVTVASLAGSFSLQIKESGTLATHITTIQHEWESGNIVSMPDSNAATRRAIVIAAAKYYDWSHS